MLITFFRPKALLRGTLPSRPNKGVFPPSGKHLQNKEFSVQYVYNIKVKENKTRITIKISEFYKWYSSNTVNIRSARCLFRRYFGLFFFLDLNRRYLLIHWWFLEGFLVLKFFCPIFVIKGVPGDLFCQVVCSIRAFPDFTETLKRDLRVSLNNRGFSSLRAHFDPCL